MENLLQETKCCWVTGATYDLHKHHIYAGSRRRASDEWGCWIWLRADWHNLSYYGIHFNHDLDMEAKQKCQEAFEAIHGHERFMEVFGKNYL